MYSAPNMDNQEDALAHALSEIMNDNAPIGWEKYRGAAACLLSIFDLHANPDDVCFDTYKTVFPPTAQDKHHD